MAALNVNLLLKLFYLKLFIAISISFADNGLFRPPHATAET
jgi:hypothetical protein